MKRKPEKIRLAGIRALTSAIPVQRSSQLSYQANWELVINLVRNIPGKDEDAFVEFICAHSLCYSFAYTVVDLQGFVTFNIVFYTLDSVSHIKH